MAVPENELRGVTTEGGESRSVVADGLTSEDCERYSRHLLVPEIGVKGQANIRKSSVLVIGVGGLGSPLILYLAAAGIGRLGLVDHDVIDMSNLQRQVLHGEDGVGTSKVASGAAAVKKLNSSVVVDTYDVLLDSTNALEIIAKYDIVADCTDNMATRYLINDACVLTHKCLVSAGCLKLEGQLTVYNEREGPCYRCLFPTPPHPSTVGSCANNGVLGVIPGVLGSLQGLEVLKIAAGLGSSLSGSMILFDGLSCTFRKVKLRGRSPTCAVCSDAATLKALTDYVAFCGSGLTDRPQSKNVLVDPSLHVSVSDYARVTEPHVLLDVRPSLQYAIVAIKGSINIPLDQLKGRLEEVCSLVVPPETGGEATEKQPSQLPIYCMCRRGNASQDATNILVASKLFARVYNVTGGMEAWARLVEPTNPIY